MWNGICGGSEKVPSVAAGLRRGVGLLIQKIVKPKLNNGECGQAFIEFALISPFVILIMLAVLSFGLLFHWSNILNNAARQGARAAAVCATDDIVRIKVDNACSSLPNTNALVVTITELDESGAPMAAGSRRRGGAVTVKLAYTTGRLTVPGVLAGQKLLTAQSTFRMECGSD
jgi:hypothetical protein